MNLKKWMCRMVLVLLQVGWCHANSVSLNVTGTGCNSCKLYKTPCASVKVDGKEYSNQYDGVTIVVVDTFNGKISSKHFKPLENVGNTIINAFQNYIMAINNHSVIVAVSKGKCSLKRSWFHYISDYIHLDGEFSLNFAEISLAIFCKGICPKPLEGQLPYSYFGAGSWHHVSMKLFMKELPTISKTETISQLSLIIGVTTASVCLLVASVLIILFWKKRAKLRRSKSCIDTRNDGMESAARSPKPSLQTVETENDLPPTYQPLNGIPTPSEYSALQINVIKEQIGRSKVDYEYLYVTEHAENDYYERNRQDAGGGSASSTTFHDYLTLYPYVVSSSPGSSHQIFKKSMNIINREQSVREEQFASYITLEEGWKEGTVYKKPSSVPKFDAPIPMPQNILRDSYLNMQESVYDNSLYQPLTGANNISTEYEVLRPKT